MPEILSYSPLSNGTINSFVAKLFTEPELNVYSSKFKLI